MTAIGSYVVPPSSEQKTLQPPHTALEDGPHTAMPMVMPSFSEAAMGGIWNIAGATTLPGATAKFAAYPAEAAQLYWGVVRMVPGISVTANVRILSRSWLISSTRQTWPARPRLASFKAM